MKMMLTIASNYSTNYFKAFDKFKRALTVFPQLMFKCSYLHSYELHVQVFDRLLRALMTSKLIAWILRLGGVLNALSTSNDTVLRR